MVLEDIGTGPKLALAMRGMRRKNGTKRGRRRAMGLGGRGRLTKGHNRSSRETPMVQPRARWELYLRLPYRLSSTRKKYSRNREMRASLGSAKTTFDTKILASLLMRVLTESTLVDTNGIIIRFIHHLVGHGNPSCMKIEQCDNL